ncbi:MAG: hypothetical protein O2868_11380 [Proteobacteria bacterium]|nr:hypothetical protein [Pseudomonadota bacterium]
MSPPVSRDQIAGAGLLSVYPWKQVDQLSAYYEGTFGMIAGS